MYIFAFCYVHINIENEKIYINVSQTDAGQHPSLLPSYGTITVFTLCTTPVSTVTLQDAQLFPDPSFLVHI